MTIALEGSGHGSSADQDNARPAWKILPGRIGSRDGRPKAHSKAEA